MMRLSISTDLLKYMRTLALQAAPDRWNDAEAIHTKVDALLLDFLKGLAFKKSDFFETREGVCRVMPSISKQLMATGPIWAQALYPVVESVVQALYKGLPSGSKSTQPMGLRSWVNRNRTREKLVSEA